MNNNKDNKEKRKKFRNKSLIAFGMAFVLLFGSSIAYFSDYAKTSTTGTVGTVKISVDDNINLLNADGKDILNPGDIRNVSFEVENEGNKSVDTEVVITLTSSEPMQNNYISGGGGKMKSPMFRASSVSSNYGESTNLYFGEVYASEYELYNASDVVAVEGYGHYPKTDASPLQMRYINGAQTQIVYVLDGAVLSGNSDFDEKEVEYKTKPTVSATDLYVLSSEEYYIEKIDMSEYIDGAAEAYVTTMQMDLDSEEKNVVVPNSMIDENGDTCYAEYVAIYQSTYFNAGVPSDLQNLYVSSDTQGFVVIDDGDNFSFETYTKEEVEAEFGITIHTFDDFDALISGDNAEGDGSQGIISAFEYNNLSEDEKANYEAIEDNFTYDLVLLFDPNSSNDFQASNVSIKVEVKAKQHRNTEKGWELIKTTVNSVIQDTIFTVEYDKMHRVELTGVKDGVDLASMTEITVPEGVEVIPSGFFSNYTNLETVNLPSTLLEIQHHAFAGCSNLTEINFPDSLEYVGENAFDGVGIESIFIPKDITFGSYPFINSAIKTAEIEDGTTAIPNSLFAFCESLEEVIIPDSVTDLGDNTFENCKSLKEIDIPKGVTELGWCLFNEAGIETLVIPDHITTIDSYAFRNCYSLREITIPASVVNIHWSAFACENDAELIVYTPNGESLYYDFAGDHRIVTYLPIEN